MLSTVPSLTNSSLIWSVITESTTSQGLEVDAIKLSVTRLLSFTGSEPAVRLCGKEDNPVAG